MTAGQCTVCRRAVYIEHLNVKGECCFCVTPDVLENFGAGTSVTLHGVERVISVPPTNAEPDEESV